METMFRHSKNGEIDEIAVIGPINEEAEILLGDLKSKLGQTVAFNLEGVTSINSLGVRAWINFVRDLSGSAVEFHRCTPDIINQINMIPSFQGHAVVKSLFAEYQCESCGTETKFLFEVENIKIEDDEVILPDLKCPSCGSDEMEFEELEESYFGFLIDG